MAIAFYRRHECNTLNDEYAADRRLIATSRSPCSSVHYMHVLRSTIGIVGHQWLCENPLHCCEKSR